MQNQNRGGAIDEGDSPWGGLTSFGAYQCLQRGKILRRRYHSFLFRNNGRLSLPVVRVQASNFIRTQVSAQHVLAGLLPRRGSAASRATPSAPSRDTVFIEVEPAEECKIAVFDSARPLMRVMRRVMAGRHFHSRDAQLADVSAALTRSLPYFKDPDDAASSDGVTGQGSAAGPRFMWIRAADYFWAYESHGLPPRPDIAGLGATTTEHLEWRFRQLFANDEARQLASGGLLGALAASAKSVVGSGNGVRADETRPAVVLFSGHDATLMPLVASLLPPSRAVLVARAAAAGGGPRAPPSHLPRVERTLHVGSAATEALARDAVPWPAYASAVVIELHRLPDDASSTGSNYALHPSAVEGSDSDAATLAFQASARGSAEPCATPEARHRVVWSFDNDVLTVDGAAAAPGASRLGDDDSDAQFEASLLAQAQAVRPAQLLQTAPTEPPTPAAGAPAYPQPAPPAPGQVLRMTGWMPLESFLLLCDSASAAAASAVVASARDTELI